jgi:hypothetical protein
MLPLPSCAPATVGPAAHDRRHAQRQRKASEGDCGLPEAQSEAIANHGEGPTARARPTPTTRAASHRHLPATPPPWLAHTSHRGMAGTHTHRSKRQKERFPCVLGWAAISGHGPPVWPQSRHNVATGRAACGAVLPLCRLPAGRRRRGHCVRAGHALRRARAQDRPRRAPRRPGCKGSLAQDSGFLRCAHDRRRRPVSVGAGHLVGCAPGASQGGLRRNLSAGVRLCHASRLPWREAGLLLGHRATQSPLSVLSAVSV